MTSERRLGTILAEAAGLRYCRLPIVLLNLKRNAWRSDGRRLSAHAADSMVPKVVEPAFVLILLPVLIGVAA